MEKLPRETQYFSIPQVLLISAFVAGMAGLAGWTLNLEIRKADRVEIIGQAYRQALDIRLGNIEEDLRYLRQQFDRQRFNFAPQDRDRRP